MFYLVPAIMEYYCDKVKSHRNMESVTEDKCFSGMDDESLFLNGEHIFGKWEDGLTPGFDFNDYKLTFEDADDVEFKMAAAPILLKDSVALGCEKPCRIILGISAEVMCLCHDIWFWLVHPELAVICSDG
jgi:hypothetical protein